MHFHNYHFMNSLYIYINLPSSILSITESEIIVEHDNKILVNSKVYKI